MTSSETASERVQISTESCGRIRSPRGSLIAEATSGSGQRDIPLQLGLLIFMLFWYGGILKLSLPHSDPKLDLTFNNMLAHLLHGQFYVDPQIVGDEGSLRNGHTYAYWGIWCALLRLPLWICGRMNMDMTVWSCLAAVCLTAMAKIRTVLLLRRHGAHDQTANHAVQMMLAYIVLGGSEIGYLKASLYQEVVFWAIAFASVFVYLAVKGLIIQRFGLSTLSAMSACAGLALLTRVSTGIGLFLALGLLLLVLAWQSNQAVASEGSWTIRKRLRPFFRRHVLIPAGILAVFVVATGAVNYFRWGNPLTFANLGLQLETRVYSDRLARLAKYGTFNLRRIPFGLMYYFAPAWAVKTRSGNFLFEQTQTRLFDAAELPPSSLLLTDMLPLCFIALLIIALRRRRFGSPQLTRQLAAIAMGLSVTIILILAFTYLSYRYRMEFYPEIDFLAFLGLYTVVVDEELRAICARRRIWIEAAMIVSVVATFVALCLYLQSPFGPAQNYLHRGLVHGRHFVWF